MRISDWSSDVCSSALRLLLDMEQVHLAAEPPMVALLGLLETVEIGLQLLLVAPAGAVDALELRVPRIAAPIGAGQLHQLEGLAEPAGRGPVRSGAEGEPFAQIGSAAWRGRGGQD